MRSPLEYEPEWIAAIGTITVRWAAMEVSLAHVLASVMKAPQASQKTFYALINFSQRLGIVEAAVVASLQEQKHRTIAAALFSKIRRLWNTRNELLHSHYIYCEMTELGYGGGLIGTGRELGEHPKHRYPRKSGPIFSADGELTGWQVPTTRHGFAYEKRKHDGTIEHVFVNKGTFQNHAKQLLKRMSQLRALQKALDTGVAPLHKPSAPSYSKLSPRSPLAEKPTPESRGK